MAAFFLFAFAVCVLIVVMVFCRWWLVAIAAVLFVDVVGSTMYYNYGDSTMTGLESKFDDGGWILMDCGDAYRSSTGMEQGICSGGLISARDDYIGHKRVIAIGSWWSDGWVLGPSTFRIYFIWGP